PFDSAHKLPGTVIRLVFEGLKNSQSEISASPFSLTLNDGLGTTLETIGAQTSIYVSNINKPSVYSTEDTTSPTLEAYVVQNTNLFNNRYVLIYEAVDKDSGIKDVKVREGNGDWKSVKSPYLLEDQTRHSIILVQASNFSGETTSVKIDPLPYKPYSTFIFVALIILLLLIFFRKTYAGKNASKK
ncbi:MAG: hypothetical protein ACRDE5_13085, partial [Ginsengibacter sp.]